MDREQLIAELRDIADQERAYLADVTGEEAGYIADVLCAAADMLEQQDAQWVYESDRINHWHCSRCRYVTGVAGLMDNYCPHCGAKMQEMTLQRVRKEMAGFETD